MLLGLAALRAHSPAACSHQGSRPGRLVPRPPCEPRHSTNRARARAHTHTHTQAGLVRALTLPPLCYLLQQDPGPLPGRPRPPPLRRHRPPGPGPRMTPALGPWSPALARATGPAPNGPGGCRCRPLPAAASARMRRRKAPSIRRGGPGGSRRRMAPLSGPHPRLEPASSLHPCLEQACTPALESARVLLSGNGRCDRLGSAGCPPCARASPGLGMVLLSGSACTAAG